MLGKCGGAWGWFSGLTATPMPSGSPLFRFSSVSEQTSVGLGTAWILDGLGPMPQQPMPRQEASTVRVVA